MSRNLDPSEVVITAEHRRFAEFCDACRRYAYIGLCYGPPGVGKTISARYYANWDQIEAYVPFRAASGPGPIALLGSDTVFYTPKVVHSPKQIEQALARWRLRLHAIPLEVLHYEEEKALERAKKQDRPKRLALDRACAARTKQLSVPPPEIEWMSEQVDELYAQKRADTPDPTTLLMIDEADRLKTVGLEQVRAIFDQGGVGMVLIGMPGLEKRLSRYPQLYSRVGFVHEFHPLTANAVRELFEHHWLPAGVTLPNGLNDEEVMATVIRITGGNFRLLHRLLIQIARLVEINALSQITREVVETARESLVIGVV